MLITLWGVEMCPICGGFRRADCGQTYGALTLPRLWVLRQASTTGVYRSVWHGRAFDRSTARGLLREMRFCQFLLWCLR